MIRHRRRLIWSLRICKWQSTFVILEFFFFFWGGGGLNHSSLTANISASTFQYTLAALKLITWDRFTCHFSFNTQTKTSVCKPAWLCLQHLLIVAMNRSYVCPKGSVVILSWICQDLVPDDGVMWLNLNEDLVQRHQEEGISWNARFAEFGREKNKNVYRQTEKLRHTKASQNYSIVCPVKENKFCCLFLLSSAQFQKPKMSWTRPIDLLHATSVVNGLCHKLSDKNTTYVFLNTKKTYYLSSAVSGLIPEAAGLKLVVVRSFSVVAPVLLAVARSWPAVILLFSVGTEVSSQ